MADTIWVAIIVAISSSIPTIISTIYINHLQFKLKKFELSQNAKDKAVIDYLNSIGSGLLGRTYGDIEKYLKATQVLLYYFPNLDIELLNNVIKNNKEEGLDKKLEKVYPIIRQLSKSRKDL